MGPRKLEDGQHSLYVFLTMQKMCERNHVKETKSFDHIGALAMQGF